MGNGGEDTLNLIGVDALPNPERKGKRPRRDLQRGKERSAAMSVSTAFRPGRQFRDRTTWYRPLHERRVHPVPTTSQTAAIR